MTKWMFVAALMGVALCATGVIADEIKLKNGDTITGQIVEESETELVIAHESLGRITIDREQIVPPPPPEEKKAWKSHVDIAGSTSFGNTDTQSFHAGITSVREDEDDRTKLDASYYYGATDGDRNENRFTTGVLQDWYVVDTPWLYFADGRYDYDEFQSWEHRLAGHGGVGYKFIDEEKLRLIGRVGFGAFKEWGSDDDDLNPEALAGIEVAWKISERQTLEASATIYPDLGDTGEFRTISKVDWSALIDKETNMSLIAGLSHEYQSMVDPGFKHYDLKVFAGLRFDF